MRVVGIGDHLTELRETIDEWRPHVVFNLLDEFSGIISYDHYVVAYLELIRQRYTGCNPRGMMLSRDKVLTKRVLATHRVATPAFRLFPFGRRFREPSRLDLPAVREVGDRGRVARHLASLARRGHEEPARARAVHPRASQSDALVEEYIDGREIYVGVLGNTRLTTLPPWEMDFGTLPTPKPASPRAK